MSISSQDDTFIGSVKLVNLVDSTPGESNNAELILNKAFDVEQEYMTLTFVTIFLKENPTM